MSEFVMLIVPRGGLPSIYKLFDKTRPSSHPVTEMKRTELEIAWTKSLQQQLIYDNTPETTLRSLNWLNKALLNYI